MTWSMTASTFAEQSLLVPLVYVIECELEMNTGRPRRVGHTPAVGSMDTIGRLDESASFRTLDGGRRTSSKTQYRPPENPQAKSLRVRFI